MSAAPDATHDDPPPRDEVRVTPARVRAEPGVMRAAFRDLHGTRLHGFALLVMLGDRVRAARLAGDAVAAGMARTGELRHPERAAAWLRRHVMRHAPRGRIITIRSAGHGPLALEALGVDASVHAGLSALTTRERAALVADSIERLDRGDVATIVGVSGVRLDRLIRHARRRYAEAVAKAREDTADSSPTVARILAVADRLLT